MLRPDLLIEEYRKEFGNRKYEKIKQHISKSRHSKRLIKESIEKGFIPTGQDFVEMVMSNVRYSMASVDTIMVASITLMFVWQESINESDLRVSRSDIELITRRIAQLGKEMRFK